MSVHKIPLDDTARPERRTPRRQAKAIEDYAVAITALAVRGRSLEVFQRTQELNDLINQLVQIGIAVSDLGVRVLVGNAELDERFVDVAAGRGVQPVIDAIEDRSSQLSVVSCRLSEKSEATSAPAVEIAPAIPADNRELLAPPWDSVPVTSLGLPRVIVRKLNKAGLTTALAIEVGRRDKSTWWRGLDPPEKLRVEAAVDKLKAEIEARKPPPGMTLDANGHVDEIVVASADPASGEEIVFDRNGTHKRPKGGGKALGAGQEGPAAKATAKKAPKTEREPYAGTDLGELPVGKLDIGANHIEGLGRLRISSILALIDVLEEDHYGELTDGSNLGRNDCLIIRAALDLWVDSKRPEEERLWAIDDSELDEKRIYAAKEWLRTRESGQEAPDFIAMFGAADPAIGPVRSDEDGRIWTYRRLPDDLRPLMNDPAVNDSGVYDNPEKLEIPIPKAAKCSASILIAKGADGFWRGSTDIEMPLANGGHSSGLPSVSGRQTWSTRRALIIELCDLIAARFRRNKHLKAVDAVVAFQNAQQAIDDDSTAGQERPASTRHAPKPMPRRPDARPANRLAVDPDLRAAAPTAPPLPEPTADDDDQLEAAAIGGDAEARKKLSARRRAETRAELPEHKRGLLDDLTVDDHGVFMRYRTVPIVMPKSAKGCEAVIYFGQGNDGLWYEGLHWKTPKGSGGHLPSAVLSAQHRTRPALIANVCDMLRAAFKSDRCISAMKNVEAFAALEGQPKPADVEAFVAGAEAVESLKTVEPDVAAAIGDWRELPTEALELNGAQCNALLGLGIKTAGELDDLLEGRRVVTWEKHRGMVGIPIAGKPSNEWAEAVKAPLRKAVEKAWALVPGKPKHDPDKNQRVVDESGEWLRCHECRGDCAAPAPRGRGWDACHKPRLEAIAERPCATRNWEKAPVEELQGACGLTRSHIMDLEDAGFATVGDIVQSFTSHAHVGGFDDFDREEIFRAIIAFKALAGDVPDDQVVERPATKGRKPAERKAVARG